MTIPFSKLSQTICTYIDLFSTTLIDVGKYVSPTDGLGIN